MEVDSPSPREKADIPVQHDPAEAHAAAEGSTTVETITQGTGDTTARPWPPANVRAWRFVPSDIGFLDGHARYEEHRKLSANGGTLQSI